MSEFICVSHYKTHLRHFVCLKSRGHGVCGHVLCTCKTLFFILTKKGCFFILVIVLLNTTIHTYSVNQLLISWNMHGLPAGARQGALVSRGCCSIWKRHPNYALLQIGSLCLQPSTLQQKLSHGITAPKFQTVKLWNQKLHITSNVPSPF